MFTHDDHDNYDDEAAEAAIEQYHAGYDMFRQGKSCPAEAKMVEGWRDAQRASRVRVIMPRRPEGYYHMPIGTYD